MVRKVAVLLRDKFFPSPVAKHFFTDQLWELSYIQNDAFFLVTL